MPSFSSFPFVLLFSAAVGAPRPARATEPYDVALARADAAARRGDLLAAARAIAAVVPSYPQDYAIALTLGRIDYRAALYADAERAFRVAVARAPGARDAHLGLGWALAREGRCDSASEEFKAQLDGEWSYADSARPGLAACAPSTPGPWTLGASWNEFLFPNHPFKSNGTGVLTDAAGLVADHWRLAAAYRFVEFETNPGSPIAPFAQNEGYAHLGYETTEGGLVLDSAVVEDGSGLYGTSFHAGASARWSRYGDVLVHGAMSIYKGARIGRVAPEWRIRVTGPFSIVPGFGLQLAGAPFADATLTGIAEWSSVSIWAGGKYGEEVRPAYLDQNVVYDIPERVEYGAWAGARVRLYRGLWARASYSFDRLRRTDSLSPRESDLHAFAMGPSVNF